ncbi:hypothetical protein AB0C33_14965 [Nonomuraea sp. NPDC048881]|uniref:hypothetical protein n=1 Tax=Nonomuraea sp. NPDC048881 TaxID=3155030 RepID=UPI0033F81AB5
MTTLQDATKTPPPNQVWRHQDAAMQASGVDACPAGWPRPRVHGPPLPWITPVLDGVVYWTQLHGGRLLRCQQDHLCQVCGERLPERMLVLADLDGELVTDAGMHRRRALLSLTVCEGVSPRLLLAEVTPADLRHKGWPSPDPLADRWLRWGLTPHAVAGAARVGTAEADRLLTLSAHRRSLGPGQNEQETE